MYQDDAGNNIDYYLKINIMEVTEKSTKTEISELLNHTAQETVYSFIAECATDNERPSPRCYRTSRSNGMSKEYN